MRLPQNRINSIYTVNRNNWSMVDIWWIYGGYMVGIWWIYGVDMVLASGKLRDESKTLYQHHQVIPGPSARQWIPTMGQWA